MASWATVWSLIEGEKGTFLSFHTASFGMANGHAYFLSFNAIDETAEIIIVAKSKINEALEGTSNRSGEEPLPGLSLRQ